MNPATETMSPQKRPSVWWREPIMWMVVGGPLAVVVAGLTTAYIAISGADPVIDKVQFERDLKIATEKLDGQARLDALIKLQPAHQARNHAASPVVPKLP